MARSTMALATSNVARNTLSARVLRRSERYRDVLRRSTEPNRGRHDRHTGPSGISRRPSNPTTLMRNPKPASQGRNGGAPVKAS